MCRIAAFIDFNKQLSYNPLIILEMRDSMRIGGPDDQGFSIHQDENGTIGFGHRRLSIIDLSISGHQPMVSADQSLSIIFNGEIYNYKEIRTELIKAGHIFETHTDTEVILKSFLHLGIGCLERFIGMFAFILHDKKSKKVYAVRDRAGVKPLYYYQHSNLLLFGSELKSFHFHPNFEKQINPEALALFLQLSYIPAPHSIFKNTYKILPGHYLTIDLSTQEVSSHVYWDVMTSYTKPLLDKLGVPEIITETERLLQSACNYRMVADVPVGVFLSGGYDSSLVTALLQKNSTKKIKTFTIGFHEEKFNEAPYAKAVAAYLGTDHTEYYCTQKDALDIIPLLPDIYDEPFGDSSAIPTALVSRIAQKSVKVALSADGGDELFGGYEKYSLVIKLNNKFNFLHHSIKKKLGNVLELINPELLFNSSANNGIVKKNLKLSKFMQSENMSEMAYWYGISYTPRQLEKMLIPAFAVDQKDQIFSDVKANDDINSMLALDYKSYLTDDILVKVDRATMSTSLEGREPLIDHRLIEWAAQLPGATKIKDNRKKYILKEIVHKYIPKQMMDRKKMGFGVPITTWFKDELKEYFDEYLSFNALSKHNLLNIEMVNQEKNLYYSGMDSMAPQLWNLLIFQMWYQRWM